MIAIRACKVFMHSHTHFCNFISSQKTHILPLPLSHCSLFLSLSRPHIHATSSFTLFRIVCFGFLKITNRSVRTAVSTTYCIAILEFSTVNHRAVERRRLAVHRHMERDVYTHTHTHMYDMCEYTYRCTQLDRTREL